MSIQIDPVGLPKRELQELSTYEREINESHAQFHAKNTRYKCSIAALALIAILAAGGGAAMIAASGGPASNLLFFYGGVGIGSVSIGCIIGTVVILIRAKQLNNRNTEELVPNGHILRAMLEGHAQSEGIRAIIHKMNTEVYRDFTLLTVERILPPERLSALTEQEEMILLSLKEHDTFKSMDSESRVRILGQLDYNSLLIPKGPWKFLSGSGAGASEKPESSK